MAKTYNIPVRNFKLKLAISEAGFPLSPASLLLANNFKIKKGEVACDIGTGCGIQAITAAKLGAEKIYASDINPHDCKIAKKNAGLNKLSKKISIYHGSLLEPFTDLKFDVVIANLPQTPGKILKSPPKLLGYYGGDDGTDLVREVIKDLPIYLNKNGRFYFQWGQISNPKRVEKELQKKFTFKKIAMISAPFGFIEFEVIDKLLRMQKENKAIFYKKSGVLHYNKVIFECKLK
ncbi:MAG: 50S ribosomal protein L11 methyltransferase [Candidatus Buchananbacteria bacterium]|jgi:methylase of polypeptide subunit release factors